MKARFLTTLAAASIVVAPTMAVAAPANPAASLSVAKGVRAGSPVGQEKLSGGLGIISLAIGAALIALVTVAIVDDNDDSDSN